jgi:hypothetical protein
LPLLAAFQQVKQGFNDVGSLKQNLNREILQDQVQGLACVQNCAEVAKLELHSEVENVFFVFLAQMDEWQLTRFLQSLVLVEDLHVGGVKHLLRRLCDLRLRHHLALIHIGHLGLVHGEVLVDLRGFAAFVRVDALLGGIWSQPLALLEVCGARDRIQTYFIHKVGHN